MTQPTPPNNTSILIKGGLGVATVLIGVVAMIYNDKLAAAGIITSGLGITAHALS